MTKAVYLDPDMMLEYQPFEGDEADGFGISPFDVPRRIHVASETPTTGYKSLEFDYLGGKEPSFSLVHRGPAGLLLVCDLGEESHKLFRIAFPTQVDADDLPAISEAVATLAARETGMATRFNYQMIASLLKSWPIVAADLVGPTRRREWLTHRAGNVAGPSGPDY